MGNINNKDLHASLKVDNKLYKIFDVKKAADIIGFDIERLPFCLRILFENVLRCGGSQYELKSFKDWLIDKKSNDEIEFYPTRVLMQDFTGVPAIVDLAAMRDAMQQTGADPLKVNPLIPVDLVIDHSVQVDSSGDTKAFEKNVKIEMERNIERYKFLKWGQANFNNFRVVPPGTGICHQVNLEYLAKVVWTKDIAGEIIAYPDSIVGTDSHTTMINALSVLGWGVGGIEAEAAMLGQSLPMILPEVIGVKLINKLNNTATATDLVLTITQNLRKKGVVGKFVEFFGSGLDNLSLADRATISNMAPEYGATCGFFSIDAETIKYLNLTARDVHQVKLVEEFAKAMNMWRLAGNDHPEYTDVITLDLSTIETSLSGPKRPQDRVKVADVKTNFISELPSLVKGDADVTKKYQVENKNFTLSHGSIAIAAITSCTNTSNPSVMIAAGLVAKKACELGLTRKPWVKTSLAPGSQVVSEYYKQSGLDKYLDMLGFHLVGYGCTTCIGNSGPLLSEIEDSISKNQIVVASILSGNRNFEGRVHQLVRANYLASPPLVVVYSIIGNINIDITKESIGTSKDGNLVYLKDLWPTRDEIDQVIRKYLNSDIFRIKYSEVFLGDANWQDLEVMQGDTYNWDKNSTYINNPPYFENIANVGRNLVDIKSAKILAIFGDSITTDHISPAGNINKTSPAAKYLINCGVSEVNFNSYGSRRGNHEVMMRGTFANNRIKNRMCSDVEGGVTINQNNNKLMSIYDAAMDYKKSLTPLVIFAGKEYGTGSSRDWAAKGTSLLGIRAVIAESFERIHRSNLAGMGVLPLIVSGNSTIKSLMFQGNEEIDIVGLDENIAPHQPLKCSIKRPDGKVYVIDLVLQIFTENELEYLKYGSIMHYVVKELSRR